MVKIMCGGGRALSMPRAVPALPASATPPKGTGETCQQMSCAAVPPRVFHRHMYDQLNILIRVKYDRAAAMPPQLSISSTRPKRVVLFYRQGPNRFNRLL